jgi:hypothetical protein
MAACIASCFDCARAWIEALFLSAAFLQQSRGKASREKQRLMLGRKFHERASEMPSSAKFTAKQGKQGPCV